MFADVSPFLHPWLFHLECPFKGELNMIRGWNQSSNIDSECTQELLIFVSFNPHVSFVSDFGDGILDHVRRNPVQYPMLALPIKRW